MAWYPFQELANMKPLFIGIQATVLAAILLTTVFIGRPIYSGIWSGTPSSTDAGVTHVEHVSNISQTGGNETIDNFSDRGTETIPSSSKFQNIWEKAIWESPPAGSKMPDLNEFQLTKQMVADRAKDNVIIVTFGNHAFMDFILTWVKHLTDLGVYNLLVGAMDVQLLEALYWRGIPVFNMGSNMSTVDVGWGSKTFHKMGREKVLLINAILPFGYELLMCDTDMVWLKNPLPYFARFPGADILTSSDQVIPTVVDDKLADWEQVNAAYNIGIFHWRPTDVNKKLAKEWLHMLLADDNVWDQNGFNELLHKTLGPPVDKESGLVYAYDGTLKLGILPASIFCSGHTYFVQAMYQQLKLEPYAVHTTFQFAGTEGKRHRLREAMLFYDQPEYYDTPGGFLSFKPSIPKSLLLGGAPTLKSHFSLVNYQIKQVRTALAIASLLNRTLVMPPLWCRLDRLWFGHPGILPGTMTRTPFVCPMDHVLEVNVMLHGLPEDEFGPVIDFREYSFLDNPLLPKQVKESMLDVELCDEGSFNCHANEKEQHGVLRFPKHSNEETFKAVFSSYKHVKVIRFSSMQDAFQGFSDEGREEKFRHRVKRYVGIWCCVDQKRIGHIYYDMYWDEKPNWKPVLPETEHEDHPNW
ncbi:arabinosyltransferase XEG113 isoform X2 [Amborella trichopoda]|uniref:Nucleotide-diphospho-sugar transferase domain-containing protein n=1 Tax=Amborella trichopoda TaxID=13333 RepID=W1NHU8_AMBTC|nr:arabinosyltransferase XEG113 isoform X2 [Amborella trichopoda]ERM94769.1 hypothetical protein AMTR_s00011p00260650 [Amborella trichopoda]|eukprot:XP_006878624.1 arabinosyltransferase XEG113 isoform X2 [Amborella trichopoda]